MAKHEVDVIADELARVQSGCFARWQLLPRGASQDVINRRVRSQRWMRHAPGVYSLPSHPPVYDQLLWIAWLAVGPDAVVSHESAAQLHGITGVVRGRVVVTTTHPKHPRVADALVHQINDILPHHRTAVRGIPTTSLARTVVDLAPWVGPETLLQLTEAVKHDGKATYEEIGVVLAEVARRGKPGCGKLAWVLDTLSSHGGIERSVLERRLLVALKERGLPPPVLQLPLPGRSLPASCVDLGYPEAKLVIEADGRRWHGRVADVNRDRERDAEAARHGWQTLRLLAEHVVHDPAGTGQLVAEVLATRHAQLAS